MTAMHNVTGCREWSSAHRPICASAGCLVQHRVICLALYIADTKNAILCHLEKSLCLFYELYVLLVFSQARKFLLTINLASHQKGY